MALTSEDLRQIKDVVNDVVHSVVHGIVNDAVRGLATKDELAAAVAPLATKDDLDRMESRMLTAMGLIERDAFGRLDDHERRLRRLERSAAG